MARLVATPIVIASPHIVYARKVVLVELIAGLDMIGKALRERLVGTLRQKRLTLSIPGYTT